MITIHATMVSQYWMTDEILDALRKGFGERYEDIFEVEIEDGNGHSVFLNDKEWSEEE